MWKLWGGKRIDPLLWTSLVPKAVTVHVSTWAGSGLLLAGQVAGKEALPGFVPGSLDSHMKGVWGPCPTLSVFLLGCSSPDAKGTSHGCRFTSFVQPKMLWLSRWKWSGFPEVQRLCFSKPLCPLKCCNFFRHFGYFEQIYTFIYGM